MSWLRGVRRVCTFGAAVTLVGAGAYLGLRVVEQRLPATLLGQGAYAKSFRVHWSKSTAWAEDIQFPLPYAKDHTDNALRLRADKLWLTYDRDALLRKRFVFPNVLIQGAVIAPANLDGLVAQSVVDMSLGQGIEFDFDAGPTIEFGDAAIDSGADGQSMLVDDVKLGSPSDRNSLGDPNQPAQSANAPELLSLVWLDQINQVKQSLASPRFASGRQVAIDADMVTEQLQAQFEQMRQQAQRLVKEARDLQLQLSSLNNVLRHEDQLRRSCQRIEQIFEELKQQRLSLNVIGKRLDERQALLRSQAMEEKYQLRELARTVQAPSAAEISELILSHCVEHELGEAERLAVVLADLVRKPYAYAHEGRGQLKRGSDNSQPEFAAQSTKIQGTVALDGRARPFEAHGRFFLASMVSTSTEPLPLAGIKHVAGSDQWHMSIQLDQDQLELQAHSLAAAEGSVAVQLSSSSATNLEYNCQVTAGVINAGTGQLSLPTWLEQTRAVEAAGRLADLYRHADLFRQFIQSALQANEETPEAIRFDVLTRDGQRQTQVDAEACKWLRERLENLARQQIAAAYEQATAALDQLISDKLTGQKSLLATLRRDAEAHLSSQFDEMHRIQSTINAMIEQRVGGYMARQPQPSAQHPTR